MQEQLTAWFACFLIDKSTINAIGKGAIGIKFEANANAKWFDYMLVEYYLRASCS